MEYGPVNIVGALGYWKRRFIKNKKQKGIQRKVLNLFISIIYQLK